MFGLPNSFRPLPDELIWSYINRLAKANCGNPITFANYYFYPNDFHPSRKREYDYSWSGGLSALPYLAGLAELTDVPYTILLEDHTLLPVYLSFLSPDRQARYIDQIFANYPSEIDPTLNSNISSLRYCPVCMAETLEMTGEPVYFRKHNGPGVEACPIHGCLLEEEPFNERNEFEKSQPATEWQTEYSQMVWLFLESRIKTNWEQITALLNRSLKLAGGTSKKNLESLHRKMSEADIFLFSELSQIRTVLFHSKDHKQAYVPPESVFRVLLYLKKYENCPVDLFSLSIDETDLSESGAEMNILEKSVYLLVAKKGSRKLAMHPFHLLQNWPFSFDVENLSVDETVRKIITDISCGEYKWIGSDFNASEDLAITHLLCGKELSVKFREFAYEGVRCNCEHMISFEEARNSIENTGEFELIEFTGTNHPVRILHKGCGKTFVTTYRKFLDRPWCKICQPKAITRDNFSKIVHNLVGDEYSVTGEYVNSKTPLTMFHKTCRSEFLMAPYRFLQGFRCPRCKSLLSDSDFIRLVSSLSGGEYSALRPCGHEYWKIQNNNTLKTIKMYKPQVLQELRRPTPSPFLPLTARNISEVGSSGTTGVFIGSKASECRDWILKHTEDGKLLFIEDIPKDLFDYTSVIKRAPVDLVKRGVLEMVDVGIYCRKGSTWKDEEIARQKYLKRDGKTIGYLTGPSLAWHIGLTDEKPAVMNLKTNKEAGTHGRTVKIRKKTRVKIHRGPTEIDETNALYLGVLDLLVFRKKYLPTEREIQILGEYILKNDLDYDRFRELLKYYPYGANQLEAVFRKAVWKI